MGKDQNKGQQGKEYARMELFERKEERIDWIREISEGSIALHGALDTIAYVKQNGQELYIAELAEKASEIRELFLFYYNCETKRMIGGRNAELVNGRIRCKFDQTLLLQMKVMDFASVRPAIAVRFAGAYFCGWFRNKEARKAHLDPADRLIGKCYAGKNGALAAYWTEGGILTLRRKDEQKIDKLFFRARLAGSMWEAERLTVYVETPLLEGTPRMVMESMTTKRECAWAKISLSEQGCTGLKRVFKAVIDLTGSPGENDAYRPELVLDGQKFRVFAEEAADEKETIRTISLKDGGTMEVAAVRETDGLFTLQLAEKIYPVMCSVVTAVYNTAPFLAEMINSVLMQDTQKLDGYIMGNAAKNYAKRIYQHVFELILVDDGSTDGSGEILDDYAAMSDRIRVIHKENGGVSSARNAGIDAAVGKYINFADSDDMLSKNFFAETLFFFENHEDSISMVSCPMNFFDGASGKHWTDYKFGTKNEIVDLSSKSDVISVFVCSSLFRLQDVKTFYFDTKLVNGEDIVLIHKIFMHVSNQIGLVASTKYQYRRRSTGEASAIQNSKYNAKTYTEYLENVLERLLLEAKEEFGNIPKYIQHTVMGQLQWKFEVNDKGEQGISVLGKKGFTEYKNKALALLQYLDDDVILSQKKIWSEHFYYMLKHKYGRKPELIRTGDDVCFCFGGSTIRTRLGNCYIKLEFLWIKNNVLHLEGFAMNYEPDIDLHIYINDEPVPYQRVKRDANKYTFDDICFYATSFLADYPLGRATEFFEVRFTGQINDMEVAKKDLRFAKTMPLAKSFRKSYYMNENWAVRCSGSALLVYNLEYADFGPVDFEGEFVDEILKSKHAGAVKHILSLRRMALERLANRNQNKKLWLVSDRRNVAGDNGEAMFRYLHEKGDENIESYFVIREDSPDYGRMKEFGGVVAYGSDKHFLLHLMADVIVSSAGDEFVINPWTDTKVQSECIRDLLARPKFIFLQHGVIKDDVSSWLNRYNKNITGFVCAAEREAQSILDYDYYYEKENVWLTGLPRHDRLYHDEKRYVTIMPTWRQWFADKKLGNIPGKGFSESEYFLFFNRLVNHERLLAAADTFGYRICFMPHPSVQSVIHLFDHDVRVKFFAFEKPYSEIYAESNLVVTDYSSACMDFALLRKPVVYCQFDHEQFFCGEHIYTKGYFDYEKDGFGEVTYDMETLVDVIISYMQDGCQVYEPYGSRMDRFFAFHDKGNCERVYRRIKELG